MTTRNPTRQSTETLEDKYHQGVRRVNSMSLAICSAAVTRLHPRTARMSLEVQGYRPASLQVFFHPKKKIVVGVWERFRTKQRQTSKESSCCDGDLCRY